MYRKQIRRRRAVLVALIVVSLALLSTQFSEAESGPLHTLQRGVATIFSPIQEGASLALKPARDLVSWVDETFAARGENDELRAEVAKLRNQVSELQGAAGDNLKYEKLLDIDSSAPLDGYEPVTARVIGRSPTVWFGTVTVNEGSGAGVERNDAVINGDGLVGRVREVTSRTAEIELITDPDNAVSAEVLPDGPQGIVAPAAGDPDDLQLDFVDGEQPVEVNQMLATAGWSDGTLSSAYPPGIPIGTVESTDGAEEGGFQRIGVTPFADLRQLEYLQVMTGGPERPGVPG